MELYPEFASKKFLQLLPSKGKNGLSANARLVFSLLAHKLQYGHGLSLERIGSHLGMAAHHGVKTAIEELKSCGLVRLEDQYAWHAVDERPPIFAGKGFIKVYLLRKREHGTVISNLDNLTLWVLFHLQRTKWKWPKNRNATLASLVGIDRHNISRQLGRLKVLGLIDDAWSVQAHRIDPDWFRDQKGGEDQKVQPLSDWPHAGHKWGDELLEELQLHFHLRGVARETGVAVAKQLVATGCLLSIPNLMKLQNIKQSISKANAVDLPSIQAIIEASAGNAKVTTVHAEVKRHSMHGTLTPSPRLFSPPDLEGGGETAPDPDFESWLLSLDNEAVG